MSVSRGVLLFLFILTDFLFIDFPGAKIMLYAGFILILLNFIYTRIVVANFNITRKSDNLIIFTGIKDTCILSALNASILPVHAILINDYSDLNISSRQSHAFIVSISPHASRDFDYILYGRKRGSYRIGPTRAVFGDLLGLYSFSFEIDTVRDVIVLPRIYKIPQMSYKSLQPQGVIRNRVPIFEDPSIVTGAREYEHGDDIKKINWKISARHDKIFINTYQHSISSNSLIILNLFNNDFSFREREYYVDRAVELCASLANELYMIKQSFGLTSNCLYKGLETVLMRPLGKSEDHLITILTDLALAELSMKLPLKNVFDYLKNLRWGLSLYLITTGLDSESLMELINLKVRGHSITLLNTGPEIKKDMSLWNIGFQSFYAEGETDMINLIRI
jgi:uncharacterized protein (DUF58 family)